ncbi:MAG: YIP1 family protein [Chloroflexi bacterium]|nr:YIP1 family protein [Chloroflexota bacterium]
MIDRMWRAIKLDSRLFREVADNPSLTGEGALVAVIVALISSIGVVSFHPSAAVTYVTTVINSLLLGWVLWSVVAYFIGAKLFGGRSSIVEMLRTLGYANSPRLIGVLGFIPCIGWIFSLAGSILSLIAGIIAIRESMEFDTSKAIVTAIIGFILFVVVSAIIALVIAAVTLPFQALQ